MVNEKRSACAIACTLDLVGDKWTLLIVRDLLFRGKHTYQGLLTSRENIPSNTLADRLKRLLAADLIVKSAYQHNPVRYKYSLTKKGEALRPLLIEMGRWGSGHIEGTTIKNHWT